LEVSINELFVAFVVMESLFCSNIQTLIGMCLLMLSMLTVETVSWHKHACLPVAGKGGEVK